MREASASRKTLLRECEGDRALAIKRAAQDQWTRDPAGALALRGDDLGTPASFARVERHRYEEQPWMHGTFGFERFAGKEVLEIGVGLGTDHLQFARAGARMTGIDITPRCIELTKQRFEQEGLNSRLHVMDAEKLEFKADSFDVVYSFGVLHHTASPERAIYEARRVLRPGGVFIGGLYNRRSVFVALMLYERIIQAEWRHESFQERLSRIEHSTSEGTSRPYVRLFTAPELWRLLRGAGFQRVRIAKRHSGLKLRRRVPPWLDDLLGRTAGWYLIHEAS